jgi:organic radical activating enzyme
MSEIELVANFSGAEPAYAAAEVLQELGYRGIHVIIAAQCTIRVRAPAESVDVVTSACQRYDSGYLRQKWVAAGVRLTGLATRGYHDLTSAEDASRCEAHPG